MKLFTNKEISKKIVIAIIIVMLFNFTSPTVSHAGGDIGVLFTPLMEFLCTVADLVLEGLQGYFVGNREIAYDGPPNAEFREFHICYSPGAIFSNKVAGLKTNFINASGDDNEITTIKRYEYMSQPLKTIDATDIEENQDYEEFFEEQLQGLYNPETDLMTFEYYANPEFFDFEATEIDYIWRWNHGEKMFAAIMIDVEVIV